MSGVRCYKTTDSQGSDYDICEEIRGFYFCCFHICVPSRCAGMLLYNAVAKDEKRMPAIILSIVLCMGRTNLRAFDAVIHFFNWGIAIAICRSEGKHRQALMGVAVIINLFAIALFKYQGFFAQSVNTVLGFDAIPNLGLPLPIGISFYTLQALSYVIDVYRRIVEPQRNLLYLGMYIACWPQLIAGPIVRYSTIQEQIESRNETVDRFARGVRLFLIGFAKKTLLADTISILSTSMLALGPSNIGFVGAWCGVIAYTFQIYFDFSGYSDMAIGLGTMLGFDYLRNFNWPYISKSVTEFWRRWHVSLSSFFRDYVYIPLGGSRVSRGRWVFNLGIVWFLTGLWHGASWNYVLWGLWWGCILICEKLLWGETLSRVPNLIKHAYSTLLIVLGWSLFWLSDLNLLIDWWHAMFGGYGLTGSSTIWELQTWSYWPLMLVCIVASTPIVSYIKYKLEVWVEGRQTCSFRKEGLVNERMLDTVKLCSWDAQPTTEMHKKTYKVVGVVIDVALIVLFMLGIASIAMGQFSPFIYFQF